MKAFWIGLTGVACCALASVPGMASAAVANGFWTGPYIGGGIGINDASGDYVDSSTSFTASPHIGFNTAVPFTPAVPLVLGADFFGEFNTQADHNDGRVRFGSRVYGMDFLAGLPIGAGQRVMPYFKLGFGHLSGTGDLHGSDTNVRYGLGAEYELERHVGLTAQWIHEDADRITNDNFAVGVNYHF